MLASYGVLPLKMENKTLLYNVFDSCYKYSWMKFHKMLLKIVYSDWKQNTLFRHLYVVKSSEQLGYALYLSMLFNEQR